MGAFKITIFGAGNVGSALAAALGASSAFEIEVVDPSEQALDRLRELDLPVRLRPLPNQEGMASLLKGRDVAVAAAPERAISAIARAAAGASTHFLDFSPLQPATRQILEPLSRERLVLNGCGVSPGLVENMATSLVARCAPVRDLTIRVGSIPRYPTNRLGYGQIWDIDGLIDEYISPCEALRDGKPVLIAALEGQEQVVLDGVAYEGFTTSRGLRNFDMFRDAGVSNVTFKTLRYPGHLDHMRFLLDDLGLRSRRDMLRSLLLNGLPIIEEDVLVMFLTARGESGARKTEASLSYRFRPNAALGPFNAMTSVAAGHAAALLSLVREGKLGRSGFVAHHGVSSQDLLASPHLAPLQA